MVTVSAESGPGVVGATHPDWFQGKRWWKKSILLTQSVFAIALVMEVELYSITCTLKRLLKKI